MTETPISPSCVDTELDTLRDNISSKLKAGCGECLYTVVDSKDVNIRKVAQKLDADCVLLRQIKAKEDESAHNEYLIRSRAPDDDFQEVRVAVVGNVDAGKSTLLGVLTYGELDNGRGLARRKLFRHKHEFETGRTSSVGNDILGFDSQGQVVNETESRAGHLNWNNICRKSSKVITFIDLCGHEKYLKTTISGITGHNPDFVMLIVGANSGIDRTAAVCHFDPMISLLRLACCVIGMSKEHLGLALALSVPVFVIVTKIDMCPPNVKEQTLNTLQRLLKSSGCRKIPVMVQNEDDVVLSATNFATERICPIFQISNVTGTSIDLLKIFLNLLMTRTPVTAVVSGLVTKGVICVGNSLNLGPDSLGHYQLVAIRSIHRKRMPVCEVRSGQSASFALKRLKRADVRKGMVLLGPSPQPPPAYWEFTSEILILHHATTISVRYQAVIHCGSVRQTAQILHMSADCLRTGDKAKVHFRFIKNPEYLNLGQKMIFREGRTKAIGTIIALEKGSCAPNPKDKAARIQRRAEHRTSF
ncbi:GTP-binding protein 1, partial [Fragariocoptes setiger]